MKGSLSLDLPLYSTLRSSLWLWTTRTSHHAPEEQHQGLEERPEVVVPVDAGVVIQSDVSKHLRRRQAALQTSAAGRAAAVPGKRLWVRVWGPHGQDCPHPETLPERPVLLLGLEGQGVWLQRHLCIYFQGRENLRQV